MVGVALFLVAVFIVVQSIRCRASTERIPLPLLLIVFSLVLDVTITTSRDGTGPAGALLNNRYVMANLILLTGIVIYACAHIPPRRERPAGGAWRVHMASVGLIALAIFLIVQVTVATGFGLVNGRATRRSRNQAAQLAVNQDRIPDRYRLCELYVEEFYHGASLSTIQAAAQDQLGEFQPSLYRFYRELGQPALFAGCLKTSTGALLQPKSAQPQPSALATNTRGP